MRLRHGVAWIKVVLIAIVVTFGVRGANAGVPEHVPTEFALVQSMDGLEGSIGDTCGVECSRGMCAEGEHHAPEGFPNNEVGAGAHNNCFSGTCQEQHPVCDGDWLALEEVERLRADLVAGDAQAVRQWLDHRSGAVELNRKRSALQALGCGEEVLLHVPLTETAIEYLAQ